VINPNSLPYQIDSNRQCVPVYPHNALKTNTIFEVVKRHGGVTAWADKHPAYELVRGPSGAGLDDLYTPEVTNVGGLDNTVSVICTHENDHLKTVGIINEIHGLTHDGQPARGVPKVFGTDYQAVSVGQKVSHDTPDRSCINSTTAADAARLSGQPGGYIDGSGTPTEVLSYALDAVDSDLRLIVEALRQRNLYESTLIIVTAKHGQSPIDPTKLAKIGDAVSPILTGAGVDIAQITEDDVALIWLKDQSQTAKAAAALEADRTGANTARIDEVLSGNALAHQFNNPAHDPRTPDIIVEPIPGTIYTKSKAKVAEHGGFAEDDTHVALLVVNSGPGHRDAGVVTTGVHTTQVAPTILRFLDLTPAALDAVRMEGTQALPGS